MPRGSFDLRAEEPSIPHTEAVPSGPTLNNKAILSEIKRRLGDRGIDVAVQPAVTTSSFYLTFDYGVLKKARIGDHRGKGYNYSFEIGEHFLSCRSIPEEFNGRTFLRRVYPSNHVGQLVMDVLALRASMVSKYGQAGYDKILARKKAEL